jgi:hypothetical protein
MFCESIALLHWMAQRLQCSPTFPSRQLRIAQPWSASYKVGRGHHQNKLHHHARGSNSNLDASSRFLVWVLEVLVLALGVMVLVLEVLEVLAVLVVERGLDPRSLQHTIQ